MECVATDPTATEMRTDKVQVGLLSDAIVTYASYQNNVPLVRSLSVTNETDESLCDVEVIVRCEPAFAEMMRLRFERLDARETRKIEPLDLKFEHRSRAKDSRVSAGRRAFPTADRTVHNRRARGQSAPVGKRCEARSRVGLGAARAR